MKTEGARRVFGLSIPTGVVNNVFSMYGIYCSTYLLAVVTVPYLSRTLGPAAWGLLAAVQSFAGCLLLGVEFGFTFSGTREAARSTGDWSSLRQVVSAVQGAKFLLGLISFGIAFVVELSMPLFREHAGTFWWGIAWAVLQGSNLMWFFQAIERMRLMATLDFAIRAIAVAATFVFVHGPEDAWVALACQAGASFFSLLISVVLVSRISGFEIPTMSAALGALRGSARTFIPRNASNLFSAGNTFLLGFFARPEIVGFYAGADRISRALIGLLAPASEAVYPRISHVATQSRDRTLRLARLGGFIMCSVGIAMGAVMWLLAPLLVRLLLGPGYDAAIMPLRILSLLAPLVALRNVLTIHWMLPLDLEKELNAVVLACGALNVVLAVLIAPRFGGVGMAWVVVATQACAAFGAWVLLRWMRLDPFSNQPSNSGSDVDCGVHYTPQTVAK
ncbi:MAG TPA: oligosaccharide flippase family protein [Bryobacteraceae bacterium]|nr:oligosaccharide flippase family protein [Bryobacteraceae bacterium]